MTRPLPPTRHVSGACVVKGLCCMYCFRHPSFLTSSHISSRWCRLMSVAAREVPCSSRWFADALREVHDGELATTMLLSSLTRVRHASCHYLQHNSTAALTALCFMPQANLSCPIQRPAADEDVSMHGVPEAREAPTGGEASEPDAFVTGTDDNSEPETARAASEPDEEFYDVITPKDLGKQALAQLNAGKFEKAVELFSQALRIMPCQDGEYDLLCGRSTAFARSAAGLC